MDASKTTSPFEAPPSVLYNTNREQAESLLMHQPQGTYLFRKGGQDKQLEKVLKLPCYTLTWKAPEGKISEKVVVQSPKGYLFYDDDLTLSGQTFSSIASLVGTLHPSLKNLLKRAA